MNIKACLKNAYIKRLNTLNKNFLKDPSTGLNIFIEYLKFKRDNIIVQSENKAELTLLLAIIAEYEAWQASKEIKQKKFHWNNFCDFIKLNMEELQAPNDSI